MGFPAVQLREIVHPEVTYSILGVTKLAAFMIGLNIDAIARSNLPNFLTQLVSEVKF